MKWVWHCLSSGLVVEMRLPENFRLLFNYSITKVILDPLFLSMECF
jgi:hypothetical protein